MSAVDYKTTLFKLIDTIESEYQHAMFLGMDAICYGSCESAERTGIEERRVKRLLDAVPKQIMDARKASAKAAKIAELRRQADDLEKAT